MRQKKLGVGLALFGVENLGGFGPDDQLSIGGRSDLADGADLHGQLRCPLGGGERAGENCEKNKLASHDLPGVLVYPVEMALGDVENEFGLAGTVRSAWIHHHPGSDAAALQSMIKLVALAGGDALIGFAVQQQR